MEASSNSTQEAQILAHLEAGKTITQLEALNLYDCHDIKTLKHRTKSGKTVARYRLKKS